MPPDLLDDVLVEVARVPKQAAGDIVCVLQAAEDVIHHWGLRSLPEIHLAGLDIEVDVLDPAVMAGRMLLCDMLLEQDDVVVCDLLCVGCGEDWGGVAVDAAVE